MNDAAPLWLKKAWHEVILIAALLAMSFRLRSLYFVFLYICLRPSGFCEAQRQMVGILEDVVIRCGGARDIMKSHQEQES
jgi:hypothetical protein